MDTSKIEQLQMPATYGQHLLRLFDPEELLAGTGLSADDFSDADRRISVG